jgi:hypothetical protein
VVNPDAVTIAPWITGTIARHHNRHIHQAGSVSRQRPKLSDAQGEDVGNMMELKPTAIILHIARCPLVNMETVTSVAVQTAHTSRCRS